MAGGDGESARLSSQDLRGFEVVCAAPLLQRYVAFVMRVGDDHSFVQFDLKEKMPEHLPGGGDVACSIEASFDGFHGKVESVWFSREDISEFLSQLRKFEEARRGSVSLLNMSSKSDYTPLRFEILSVDEAGHLAVRAELVKVSYRDAALAPLKVSVSFPLDGETLSSTLIEFRKLFE